MLNFLVIFPIYWDVFWKIKWSYSLPECTFFVLLDVTLTTGIILLFFFNLKLNYLSVNKLTQIFDFQKKIGFTIGYYNLPPGTLSGQKDAKQHENIHSLFAPVSAGRNYFL